MKLPIYLDNSATTPVDPRVAAAMVPWLTEQFGNPASSTHRYGTDARDAVEAARDDVARLVNADPAEIVWTSGATESDNLALKGAALAYRARGKHIVTVATEHKAVLDTVQALERDGFEATILPVRPDGLLDADRFRDALRPDTTVASVMLVNNEIGVLQDIATLGAICRDQGVLFHVDAAQATGKVKIDLAALPVDLMSLTAHKTYGPKGIGALYVSRSRRVRLELQMHGGGHERGMRSGTLATHQIVGMAECFRLAGAEMAAEVPRVRVLRDKLVKALTAYPEVHVNGCLQRRIAHNLNVSVNLPHCDSLAASLTDIAVSSTSACSSGAASPSHVLAALGNPVGSALRITVGRFTTEAEVDYAIGYVCGKIEDCRRAGQAPLARTA